MELYQFSKNQILPSLKKVRGLHIIESSNERLLAALASTSVSNIRDRMANGHKAFIAFIDDQPAAFGWMATKEARIGELDHQLKLPRDHRYLWNFRTLEKFRGMGIYPALLQYMIKNESSKAQHFWIIHAPENQASLNGILKAGFHFVGTLYINANGIVSISNEFIGASSQVLKNEMNFIPSDATPASCWNCSSPYLTKRRAICCCATAEKKCVGKNTRLLAV